MIVRHALTTLSAAACLLCSAVALGQQPAAPQPQASPAPQAAPALPDLEGLWAQLSVTTAITEFTAVKVMLRATSPLARWLNRFAVVPPGAAASSISKAPAARAGALCLHPACPRRDIRTFSD